MNGGEVVMPFGKHKGESINEVPRNCLEWFLENVTGQETVKAAIRRRLGVSDALFPEEPEPETVTAEDFVMPIGKWKGVRLSAMSTETLAALTNAYNGSNKPESIALTKRLRAFWDARRAEEAGRKAGDTATTQATTPEDGFIYQSERMRVMVGVRPLTPWRDGWNSRENIEVGGSAPF